MVSALLDFAAVFGSGALAMGAIESWRRRTSWLLLGIFSYGLGMSISLLIAFLDRPAVENSLRKIARSRESEPLRRIEAFSRLLRAVGISLAIAAANALRGSRWLEAGGFSAASLLAMQGGILLRDRFIRDAQRNERSNACSR